MDLKSSVERQAKKRKLKKSDNRTLSVGGISIPLEGYLGEVRVQKKVEQKQQQHVEEHTEPKIVEDPTKTATELATDSNENTTESPLSLKEDKLLLKTRRSLPIWKHRSEIQEAARALEDNVIILVGETGCGKSTQVPQFLYQESWCRRKKVSIAATKEEVFVGGLVAITQPRRVAATTLAHRVSQEAGTPLGKGRKDGAVGYSVRFDHQVPKGAKIKFLTEGILLQELLRDPYLRQYSAVIIDEVHERSLDVDLLIGFLKQILANGTKPRGGVPLRVIIMSATADVDVIRKFFENEGNSTKGSSPGAKLLSIKGRQFPVDIKYESRAIADIQGELVKQVFKIHTEEPLPGDILCFLTGQEEIEIAQRLIEDYIATLPSNVPKLRVLPLYGQLSMEAQSEAFKIRKEKFTRKVVLATNIAETSVTVPGVRYVIDCGKAKVKQFRARLGMESLLAKPVSKSSAIQRAGRAGREGPGKCFRMYTEDGFNTMREADLPEILRTDVLGAILTMKARGINDVLRFPLMDAPETEAIERALVHLHFLGALDNDGSLTTVGAIMARFPVSVPLSCVLLTAAKPEFDCLLPVIDIISCITSGDDIFLAVQSEEGQEEIAESRKELQRREGDLITYLTTIQQYTAENTNRIDWCKKRKIHIRNIKQALNIRRQLRGLCVKEKLLSEAPPPDPQPFQPLSPEGAEAVLKCFLRGFALKTAMLSPDGSYVTVHGKHVVAIHPASVLHGQKKEAIMFLEHVFTNKNYAKKVSSIQASWIADALEKR